MDFQSTSKFQSKLYPDVSLTIRSVTIGRRMDFLRNQRQAGDSNGDFDWRRNARALWNALVLDFAGLTIDGEAPSVDDFFINGPEELVDEISSELVRLSTPVGATDAGDEAVIESARKQIAEAEVRMAARKNSGPQSSGTTSEAGTRTAATVPEIPMTPAESANEEIASAVPI